MNTGDADDFAAIVHGGIGKLANPQQSAFAFQLDGADSHHPDVRAPAAFGSAEEAGEPWAGSPPYWPFDSRVTSKANKGSAIATLENSPTSLP